MIKKYDFIPDIKTVDNDLYDKAKARWNGIAKPVGSLGLLEDAVCAIAAASGSEMPDIGKRALAVFCSDHGIVKEGVTQTGEHVTAMVAENFLSGRTCTSIMAEEAGVDITPVDMGMLFDTSLPLDMKIRHGTSDFLLEPAMSKDEAIQAVTAGINTARRFAEEGYSIILGGEMGIGNTSSCSALACAMLGIPAEAVTGRGAGLTDEALARKICVVDESVKRRDPDRDDPLDILSKLGGFEIAALCGLYLGSASCGIPVILDGIVSVSAALLAKRFCPEVSRYMIASHASAEPASKMILSELGLRPILDIGLKLGEGSGAVLVLPMLDMALKVYKDMISFEEFGIPAYKVLQ